MLWASDARAVMRKHNNPPHVDFGRVMNFEFLIVEACYHGLRNRFLRLYRLQGVK